MFIFSDACIDDASVISLKEASIDQSPAESANEAFGTDGCGRISPDVCSTASHSVEQIPGDLVNMSSSDFAELLCTGFYQLNAIKISDTDKSEKTKFSAE